MKYTNAWAIIWAIQYHAEHLDLLDRIERKEWWTLAHRQAMAEYKGEYP